MKEEQGDNQALSKLKREFKERDNKEYTFKIIVNSVIYGYKIKTYLVNFYYLVL